MDTILKIAIRIIKRQELVIGPLAWDEAMKVPGLHFDEQHESAYFDEGDKKTIINNLVAQYEKIFGKASHAVCRDAVLDLIAQMPPEEVPSSLK